MCIFVSEMTGNEILASENLPRLPKYPHGIYIYMFIYVCVYVCVVVYY